MSFYDGFADELLKHAEEIPYEYTVRGGLAGASAGALLGALLGAILKGSRITGALTGAGIGAIPGFAAGKTIGGGVDIARGIGRIVDNWKEL